MIGCPSIAGRSVAAVRQIVSPSGMLADGSTTRLRGQTETRPRRYEAGFAQPGSENALHDRQSIHRLPSGLILAASQRPVGQADRNRPPGIGPAWLVIG